MNKKILCIKNKTNKQKNKQNKHKLKQNTVCMQTFLKLHNFIPRIKYNVLLAVFL